MNPITEALMYAHTCGDACWHAREDICRCSCNGKNHGCLRDGGTQPERTSRRKTYVYKLHAVVGCDDQPSYKADQIAWNTAGHIIQATFPAGNPRKPMDSYYQKPGEPTKYYSWRADDDGVPALVRTASESQMRWTELQGYTNRPMLVWARWDLVDQLEQAGA